MNRFGISLTNASNVGLSTISMLLYSPLWTTNIARLEPVSALLKILRLSSSNSIISESDLYVDTRAL